MPAKLYAFFISKEALDTDPEALKLAGSIVERDFGDGNGLTEVMIGHHVQVDPRTGDVQVPSKDPVQCVATPLTDSYQPLNGTVLDGGGNPVYKACMVQNQSADAAFVALDPASPEGIMLYPNGSINFGFGYEVQWNGTIYGKVLSGTGKMVVQPW